MVVQYLLCCQVVVVSGRSLGGLHLHMPTEWARHPLMVPPITRHPSGTTPPTSTPSTVACLPNACRTEEGTVVGLEGIGAVETPTVT